MKIPLILAGLLLTPVLLADELTSSQKIIEKTDAAGKSSQKSIEQMDDKTQGLRGEYRRIQAEADQLALYNRQMESIIGNQNNELSSLTRQIDEIERTERGILPLMSHMLDTLEQFVQLDTPFLPEERSARVALLKDMLLRADVTVSEKFRRVLEAYQVEVDYGRNIEAYRGQLAGVSYDFLRLGRLALYRISNDGQQAWLWHKGSNDWLELDSGYLRDLRKALKVAQQIAAPELLIVPLPTPASLASNQGGAAS